MTRLHGDNVDDTPPPGHEAPPVPSSTPEPSESEHSETPVERDDELDGGRIRHLSALRRSAYRARSIALIFAVGGFVVAIKLVLMTIAALRAGGLDRWSLGYAMFAIVAAMVGFHFAHRALDMHREATQPIEMPPTPPGGPDFSTLSDGSQQWKNLEQIQDDARDPQHPGPL